MVDACGIVCLLFAFGRNTSQPVAIPPAHTTPDDALLLRCNVKSTMLLYEVIYGTSRSTSVDIDSLDPNNPIGR